MILATLFAVLFNLFEHHRSIRFSLVYTNRIFEEFEAIVGWLATEIVVCIEMEDHSSIKDIVSLVTHRSVEAADHRFYPHEMVLNDLDIHLSELTHLFLNFISSPEITVDNFMPYHEKTGSGHYNFACNIREHTNCISVITQYNISVYSDTQIESMYRQFFKIIDIVVECSNLRLVELLDKLDYTAI